MPENSAPSSNDGDIGTYLKPFERAAIQGQWDKLTWTVRVCSLLTGKAAEANLVLSPNQISNYDEVKQPVLLSFQVKSEAYRALFCSEQKEADQYFIGYKRRLEQLSIKWFECQYYKTETVPEILGQKIDDILRLIVVKQFIPSLKNDQLYIRLKETSHLWRKKKGHRAEDYRQPKKRTLRALSRSPLEDGRERFYFEGETVDKIFWSTVAPPCVSEGYKKDMPDDSSHSKKTKFCCVLGN
ncbi:hypothetical protein QYM36_008201 [Artemia franciscana]|uniref:Uncharacterized protein n=1 Tax=Artemia franciscana TaxID=6661 RepID=A0AA88LHU3_ARTSF|nr:hypothetical protein QYM36_008201 [Artemia franciscana]